MQHQKELFEFLYILIDIQIQKYVALPKIGIGPDARLNGYLVFQEVNELLGFADQLLTDMEQETQERPCSSELFISIFEQIKFYLDQEHLRGHAGWLLDENMIHTPLMKRINQQVEQLKQIAHSANIQYSVVSKPATETQALVERDSIALSFYILDLAKNITQNPQIDLDQSIPKHARSILRKNATTRYCKDEFAQPINELHAKYKEFLENCQHIKSDTQLKAPNAIAYEKQHREQCTKLLNRYRTIDAQSMLFTQYTGYKIGKNPEEKAVLSKPSHSVRNVTFFGGIAMVAICMLIAFFAKQHQNSADSGLKL